MNICRLLGPMDEVQIIATPLKTIGRSYFITDERVMHAFPMRRTPITGQHMSCHATATISHLTSAPLIFVI